MHRTARAIAFALFLAPLAAQSGCPDFGGHPTPARWEAAPFAACAGASVPAWHLFTPAHRAPGPRLGRAPRDARELPRLFVTYRCTGLWWLPAVPDRVRTLGYVIDQPDDACAPLNP